jgi:hypothetical protein
MEAFFARKSVLTPKSNRISADSQGEALHPADSPLMHFTRHPNNFFDFSREARLNLKRMKYDSSGERIEKWEFTRMVNSHFMGG